MIKIRKRVFKVEFFCIVVLITCTTFVFYISDHQVSFTILLIPNGIFFYKGRDYKRFSIVENSGFSSYNYFNFFSFHQHATMALPVCIDDRFITKFISVNGIEMFGVSR
ncbi:hypothetical protein D3C86_2004190 [compost metagenome]